MVLKLMTEKGVTLVELMVAVAISSVVILGITSMLKDFSAGFVQAERKNVLVMLRTRALNELTRRDAWVNTYSNSTNSAVFSCLFGTTEVAGCGSGDTKFNIYTAGSTTTSPAIVFWSSTANATRGFNQKGEECNAYPSTACPIRLEVYWRLKSWGDITDFNKGATFVRNYIPTNMMPYGYAPLNYFPSWTGVTSGGYGYFGTIKAQIEITGEFKLHSSVTAQYQADKYGFKLLKEVP